MNIDPWTILGWIGITVVGFFVVRKLLIWLCFLLSAFFKLLARRASRMVDPEPGQVWQQGEDRVYLSKSYDDTWISLEIGAGKWAETREDFKKRVRTRGLIILSSPNNTPSRGEQ